MPYAASKAGIIGLTYTLAYQLAEYNITVNAIVPGQILTETHRRIMTPTMLESLREKIPVGRFGKPEEVAHTVIFLLENDYITAEVIHVCGGLIPG